jgi:hypothetical protein
MKIFLGNSIRLPLQPSLQVIQEVPADLRAEAPRRPDAVTQRPATGSARRKTPVKT